MRKGSNALKAVIDAVKHLWMPLLGSTLTTMLTFMPIILMPGAAGEFIGGIALAVIFSLIGSYVISHTLVASMSGTFLKNQLSEKEVFTRRPGCWHAILLAARLSLPGLGKRFANTLRFAIAKPKTSILLVMCFPVRGSLGRAATRTVFPTSDRYVNMEVYMPMSSSIASNVKPLKQCINTCLNEKTSAV